MKAQNILIASVCLSVRPSVCLSVCLSCLSCLKPKKFSETNQYLVVWKQNLTMMQGPRSEREESAKRKRTRKTKFGPTFYVFFTKMDRRVGNNQADSNRRFIQRDLRTRPYWPWRQVRLIILFEYRILEDINFCVWFQQLESENGSFHKGTAAQRRKTNDDVRQKLFGFLSSLSCWYFVALCELLKILWGCRFRFHCDWFRCLYERLTTEGRNCIWDIFLQELWR